MIDSVPLIQNPNDVQQINASIIAMKKASRELDEKIVKLNSLNSELDKKIALLNSGLNKEIEDRKEAINSLDVASVGGSGKYISAISETDGKISATESEITSSVSSGNSQPVTSGGVANAIAPLQPIDSVTSGNLRPVTSNAVYTTLAKYETVEITANQLQNGFAKTNWGILTFKKIGKIVFIVCNGVYPTSQITTDTVICDIPFPTPDSSPFYFTGTKSGGPFNNYWFGISNNKLICFGTNNMPASTWILFSTSYITN